jgi:flagellar operon protein
MNISAAALQRSSQIADGGVQRPHNRSAMPQGEGSFAGMFAAKVENLKFSAHASTRMASRHIDMTPELMGKLEKAVDGAAAKGARESLVMLKNYAFIVNIPNRTVVTAMDGESLKQNIFTNIDSAVMAD